MPPFKINFLILIFAVTTACQPDKEDTLRSVTLQLDPSEIDTETELGRVLFYDKSLSVNASVSCASCHKQAFAFADNVALSSGFENRLTSRNSMPIQNLIPINAMVLDDNTIRDSNGQRLGTLFWDGRERNLGDMVLKPIVDHREMGIRDLDAMVQRLAKLSYYREGFRNVYGDEDVNIQRLSRALAFFVASITSNNTKLDRVFNGDASFTPLEQAGSDLFFGKYNCNSCHQVQESSGYLFAGTFSNIGLDPVYDDGGLESTTGNSSDNGRFKIPSLRNVELTAPYMHDGRFATLEEVIDHYSSGISNNQNLDFRLMDHSTGQPMFFDISRPEKDAIVAFLRTLTDFTMISDPDLSNPFKTSN